MDIDHILGTATLLLDGGFHLSGEELGDVGREGLHLHPAAIGIEVEDNVGVEVSAIGELAGTGIVLGDGGNLRLWEESGDGLGGLAGQLLLGKTCQDGENAEDGGDDIFHNESIYNNARQSYTKFWKFGG